MWRNWPAWYRCMYGLFHDSVRMTWIIETGGGRKGRSGTMPGRQERRSEIANGLIFAAVQYAGEKG